MRCLLQSATIVLVVSAACTSLSTAPAEVADALIVRSDRGVYQPGDLAVFRLTNNGTTQFGYNIGCDPLERMVGGSWVELPAPDRVCIAIIHGLAPDSSASQSYQLDPSLGPGEYRLVVTGWVRVGDDWDPLTQRSNSFAVR